MATPHSAKTACARMIDASSPFSANAVARLKAVSSRPSPAARRLPSRHARDSSMSVSLLVCGVARVGPRPPRRAAGWRRRRHVLVVGGWRWQRGDHCTSTELMLVCCPTLVEAARDVLAGVNAKRTASGLLTAAGWKSGGLVCWQLAGFRFGIDFASVCHTLGQRAGTLQRLQPLERADHRGVRQRPTQPQSSRAS